MYGSSGDNSIGNDVTLRFGATLARKVNVCDGAFISPNVMTIFSNTLVKKARVQSSVKIVTLAQTR